MVEIFNTLGAMFYMFYAFFFAPTVVIFATPILLIILIKRLIMRQGLVGMKKAWIILGVIILVYFIITARRW